MLDVENILYKIFEVFQRSQIIIITPNITISAKIYRAYDSDDTVLLTHRTGN